MAAETYTVKKGDTLSGIAQKYGVTTKDISGYKSSNADLIFPNEQLSISGVPVKSKTPTTSLQNMGDATSFINAQQESDIASASQADAPPARTGVQDLVDSFKQVTGKDSLAPAVSQPNAPSFEATLQQLRQERGIDSIESSINDLDAEQQDLEAQLRISKNAEIGKSVAMNVIQGRVNEQERNMMERIDFITRQKARAVSQLQTANNAIENIMNVKKLDYDTAKDQYDTEFSQNMQLFGVIQGAAQFASSEKEQEQDTARANLQIIYNSLAESGDTTSLDAAMETKVNKLELQAGLPQGFFKTIQSQKPESKILSTTTRVSDGMKYADVVYKNPDGSLSTQKVTLGSSGAEDGGSKPTEAEYLRSARSEIAAQLNPRRGQDNYVAPNDYQKARSAWVSQGFSAQQFDESFANEYVNPESYGKLNINLY